MTANKALLRQRVEQLIHRANWAEDKQKLWLKERGMSAWHEADESTLHDAATYLERFVGMFTGTGKTREERESLRIYLGEEE